MQKIGIFYGSSTGNCEIVAMEIQKILGQQMVDIFDIALCSKNDIKKYQNIILGVSTWGMGNLQEDWDDFIPVLSRENLNGKIVALYGLGDQQTYADSFVNGLGKMYDLIRNKGCTLIGAWPVKGYTFDHSKAVRKNKFVGLVIDEDSQCELTHSRIRTWIDQIKNQFI